MRLSSEKVTVPNAQQTTENGNVVLERSLAEVLVHLVGTSQELVEVVVANVECYTQTNGTPDRVSATDPALKAKHVLAVDTKLGDLFLVGGEGNKVLGNLALVASLLEEPRLGSVGVGARLGSGEGLGGNQEESGLGVRGLESLGHVSTVNVGNKVQSHVVGTVVLQGLCDHDGATVLECEYCRSSTMQESTHDLQVRATNTNVDNVGQLLAGETLPLAASNLLRELLHVVKDFVDTAGVVHDILAVDLHLPAADISQGGVVDGTVLCEVDSLASEEGITLLLEASLLGQLDQQVNGLGGDQVLAEVEEDIGLGRRVLEGLGELGEALGVLGKGLLQDESLTDRLEVALEVLPGREGSWLRHFGRYRGGLSDQRKMSRGLPNGQMLSS